MQNNVTDVSDVVVDWNFLCVRWKQIFFGMVAGLTVAGLAFMLATPRWEASALIQIGQTGEVGTTDVQLESADVVVEKMIRPAFIKAAIERAGHPDMLKELLPSQYQGNGRLQVHVMNPDTIVVTLQAASGALAKQLMESVVGNLLDEHAALMEPRLRFTQEILSSLQSRLVQEEKNTVDLAKVLIKEKDQGAGKEDAVARFMPWLVSNGTLGQDRQLAVLVNQATTEPNMRPTRMVGQVEVSDEPAFPRLSHFVVLGLLLGLVMTGALLWKCSR